MPDHSGTGSLPMRSAMPWRISKPSKSTSWVTCVIGISTPRQAASLRAARVVSTPSATWVIEAIISFNDLPRASCSPTWWLRLSALEHVAITSPIPARPAKVIRSAPAATPSLAISAIPRVMNVAFALSPMSIPSHTPAPRATMFLSAPASSTPTMSVFV